MRRLAWLILLWPLVARAEDPDLESLQALLDESVVTTASRSAEPASTAPSAMFTITAEDIRVYGIRSIDEALGFLGTGMRVEKVRDYYAGIDVGVRGLMLRDYGRHLLVLIDGHVMNSQASGQIALHEALGVPLEAIDHIEVMLGAGSVMYGANAMTAVVNVITKSAERERGVHALSELSIAAPSGADGYARWPDGRDRLGFQYRLGVGAAHDFTLGKLPASVTVRAEWQQNLSQTYQVAPTTDDTRQVRPGQTSWGGIASHDMNVPSTVATLKLADFTLRAQGVRYERSLPLVSLFDDQSAKEVRSAVRLDLSHLKQLNEHFQLSSRLYADAMRDGENSNWTALYWCAPGQIDGCHFSNRNESRWLGLEQQLRYEPRADGSLSSLLGYDLRFRDGSARPADSLDFNTYQAPVEIRQPYFHKQSVLGAVFLQQIYSPARWVTMNLGARLDIDSLFGARLSPRAALVFTPFQVGSIRASYSEAFRGPTAMELWASDPNYVLAPNRLGPEVVRSAELEWSQRIAFLTVMVRGWAERYENFISQRQATPEEAARGISQRRLSSTVDPAYVVTNDNLDRIKAYGATGTLQARAIRGFSFGASLTVSRTATPSGLSTTWPMSFGNFRAGYEFRPGGPALALAGTWAHGRRLFPSYGYEPIPSAPTHASDSLDLRLTLTSPIRPVEGLQIRCGLGTRVLPDTPYAITGPTNLQPTLPTQTNHEQPQLYLLLGVSYDH